MKKKENWIKNLIWVLILISITAQVNILIDFGIVKAVENWQEKKKNEQEMKCPPDICQKTEQVKADIKIPIEFEVIELPPLPEIYRK